MSTLGIFNTSNQAPKAVKPSFADHVFRKQPGGSATLLGLTSRIKQETITDINHHWYVQSYSHANFVLAAPAPAVVRGATQALQVVDSSSTIVGMTMMFAPVPEQVLVVGVVGNTVTVRRGIGNIAPVAQAAGNMAILMGTAFEESSLRPMAVSESMTEMQNTTQIFRNSWAISGSAAAQQLQVTGSNDASNMQAASNRHARDIEMSILFGERFLTTQVLNGQPLRRTDGLISMIQKQAPQNYIQSSGNVTFDQLDAMLDPMFDTVTDTSGMNDRLILTDKVGLKIINDLGKFYGVIQMPTGATGFGHSFREFQTVRGSFKVMEHPLFNVLPQCRGMMLVLDLSSMSVPYFRQTQHGYFNDKLNAASFDSDDHGIDAKGGSFLSELMFKCWAPEANGVIMGLQKANCSPCVPGPQLYQAVLSVSHPCAAGEVAPDTTVTLTITGAAPGKVVDIAGVNGVIQITADANGNGTATQVVGTAATYVFEVLPNSSNMNTSFIGGVATVCVTQPCGNEVVPNDPVC